MRQLKHQLILLGVLCAPGIIFSQTKNRISFQTGLVHCFFDGSPIMNFNYPSNADKPFNGLLINSLGIQYRRNMNNRSYFSIEYDYMSEIYHKHARTYPIKKKIVLQRSFSTIKINCGRELRLSERFDLIYGGGINFRTGSEIIIISRHPIGGFNGNTVYEIFSENLERNDIGLNSFAGVEYTPLKWLTFSLKIDFLGFVYVNDKKGMEKMKEVYHSPQFPTRYDLSFNLSVGINF